MPSIAVAVSGGIDSICALYLLKEAGYDCVAIHGLFATDEPANPQLANICAKLDTPFIVADLRAEFEKTVIKPMLDSALIGKTLNPCAICNEKIKFGALLDFAKKLGLDSLASGHYSRTCVVKNRTLLARPRDCAKDQSYFMALVSERALQEVRFPLANLTKVQVRAKMAQSGLILQQQPESQDICFAGSRSKNEFLSENLPMQPGPVFLNNGKDNFSEIGSHNGLWHFTIGQRRGLNLPWKEPLYVQDQDYRNNALVVAPERLMKINFCKAKIANILLEPKYWPKYLWVRLRYRQALCPAGVTIAEGNFNIQLLESRFRTAPGQIAAIYDCFGRILAAGVIESFK